MLAVPFKVTVLKAWLVIRSSHGGTSKSNARPSRRKRSCPSLSLAISGPLDQLWKARVPYYAAAVVFAAATELGGIDIRV